MAGGLIFQEVVTPQWLLPKTASTPSPKPLPPRGGELPFNFGLLLSIQDLHESPFLATTTCCSELNGRAR